jgi:hypothetical protein
MLQIRPTEIKAIADLLMQEHDDVDALARLVIETIDGIRAKRETYVLVAVHPTLQVVKAIGPYATKAQALKDHPKRISQYDSKSRAYLANLHDPSVVELG